MADRKIGLALGGGAVLGAAHVGVLRALREHNVPISAVAGTSIGAFVAALFAFEVEIDKIEEIALQLKWLDVTGFSISRYGLLSNEKLGEHTKDHIGDVNIEDASIPLAMISTDLVSGQKVVLDKGPLSLAVMASTCIPGIFQPVEKDDYLLVDGGLVENVPVSPLENMDCDYIIAVDLNGNRSYQKPDDLIDILTNALDIAIDSATRLYTETADLVIEPEFETYSRTDIEKVRDMMRAGYDTAKQKLEEADLAS